MTAPHPLPPPGPDEPGPGEQGSGRQGPGEPAPLADRPAPRPLWRKTAALAVGWGLIVFAAVIGPVPGPLGTPIAALGLVIVLNNSRWARRQFVRLKRRYPAVMGRIQRLLRGRRQRRKD